MKLLKKIIGGTLLLVSAPFAIMALFDLFGGDSQTSAGVLAGLLVFFGGLSAGGAKLLLPSKTKAPAQQLTGGHDREVLVLRAVKHFGGTIGAAQLAAHMGVPFDDARAQLNALADKGACNVIVAEDGAELFRFPDLALADGEGAKAQDLLTS